MACAVRASWTQTLCSSISNLKSLMMLQKPRDIGLHHWKFLHLHILEPERSCKFGTSIVLTDARTVS